jgi:hypothetical protein
MDIAHETFRPTLDDNRILRTKLAQQFHVLAQTQAKLDSITTALSVLESATGFQCVRSLFGEFCINITGQSVWHKDASLKAALLAAAKFKESL